MRFIDEHRHDAITVGEGENAREVVFGVEPICRVLSEHGCQIAPQTYYAARKRPVCARGVRDADLLVQIRRVHEENYDLRTNAEVAQRAQDEIPICHHPIGSTTRGERGHTMHPDPVMARRPEPPVAACRDGHGRFPPLLRA